MSVSAIILAAGLGTRMKSRQAKVLHRAGGQCLIEHVLDAAMAVVPPDRITAVVGHQSDRVRQAVQHYGIHFQQQTQQLGTGHAVLACKDLPQHRDGRVIVLYGDSPMLRGETIQGLYDQHLAEGCRMTLITTFLPDPFGYGRIIRNAPNRVARIIEEKACTPEQKLMKEVNPGIYCFDAEPLWRHLSTLQPNPAANEYYLTDIVELFQAAALDAASYHVEDYTEILGINTRVELARVDRILRERKATELMLSGVTIEKPETVAIDKHVQAGQDTVVGPYTQILGRTVIGDDCTIGAGAILNNARIGDGAVVHPYTLIDDSTLAPGAHAGPFARLRMNAEVCEDAHVGNFVELKKTRLGKGSKSMHLAYLGDSTIGESVNIGAGTITCNYDGKQKHPTHIGDGAFVGSNSTLVAPVEVGPGAYVAAGSVITKPVPEDALGIGRSHQTVKEGWAKRRRES